MSSWPGSAQHHARTPHACTGVRVHVLACLRSCLRARLCVRRRRAHACACVRACVRRRASACVSERAPFSGEVPLVSRTASGMSVAASAVCREVEGTGGWLVVKE
eukprot:6210482-Pleurochrysis_carterae.AAC.1